MGWGTKGVGYFEDSDDGRRDARLTARVGTGIHKRVSERALRAVCPRCLSLCLYTHVCVFRARGSTGGRPKCGIGCHPSGRRPKGGMGFEPPESMGLRTP